MSLFRAANSLANIASSSASPIVWSLSRSAAALHTSASRFAESQKQRTARLVRSTNIEKKAERARQYAENKPHVVLGTRRDEEETKWRNCDLAKTLVTQEKLYVAPPSTISTTSSSKGGEAEVQLPTYTNYGLDGVDGRETRDEQLAFFFKDLPEVSALTEADAGLVDRIHKGSLADLSQSERDFLDALKERETQKARQLARVVDLRNANARGIAFENRRRVIAAFSPTKNAADSGNPEVQVALLTMKIRNVWGHLMQRKKDLPSRRALRLLVHQRAKILKYIKRLDRDRYDKLLERVALEPESVEGELVV